MKIAFPLQQWPKPTHAGPLHRHSLAVSPDRLEIRFQGRKNPADETAFQEARLLSAKALGVKTPGNQVKLDELRQAFYNAYYKFVANSLIEIGETYYQDDEKLYNVFPDMNLTQDDFATTRAC